MTTSTGTQGTTSPVSLTKVTDLIGQPARLSHPPKITPRPWYPLNGHRSGLRSNCLITLASAFWILANEGGTAHICIPSDGWDLCDDTAGH